jgi:hypothetical protein
MMTMHAGRTTVLAMAGLVLLRAGAAAQTTAAELAPRIGLESYRFGAPAAAGIETLSLLTVEFAAAAAVGRALIDVSGAYARGSLTRPDGSEASLAGPTDTRVQLAVPIVRDRWTILAIGMLPTGISELSEADAEVAGAIAADLLPFRISNWGSGGGFGIGTTLAGTMGEVGVGIGATYLVGREFDVGNADAFAYRPGNLLAVRAAVDRDVGDAGKLSLQLTFQQSADDQGNGANFFRSGDRYQALVSYAFAAGRNASGLIYGGALHRTTGVFLLDEVTRAPAEDLLMAGGAVRLRAGAMLVQPLAEFRLLRREDGQGQGYLAGVGGSIELPLARGVAFAPTARARFGNVLVRAGQESGFTGFDVGATLRFGTVAR